MKAPFLTGTRISSANRDSSVTDRWHGPKRSWPARMKRLLSLLPPARAAPAALHSHRCAPLLAHARWYTASPRPLGADKTHVPPARAVIPAGLPPETAQLLKTVQAIVEGNDFVEMRLSGLDRPLRRGLVRLFAVAPPSPCAPQSTSPSTRTSIFTQVRLAAPMGAPVGRSPHSSSPLSLSIPSAAKVDLGKLSLCMPYTKKLIGE